MSRATNRGEIETHYRPDLEPKARWMVEMRNHHGMGPTIHAAAAELRAAIMREVAAIDGYIATVKANGDVK